MNPARLLRLLAIAALLAPLLQAGPAGVPSAHAYNGAFRIVLIRTAYTDFAFSRYSTLYPGQVNNRYNQAAQELHNYYFQLSNGALDLQVTVVAVALGTNRATYWQSFDADPDY